VPRQPQYDVVVVGGSAGGCVTATLYARHGLKVALLERSSDPAHYKKICTHFIQPAAMGILRKLGLDAKIEAAGGLRNELEVWTQWGWIRAGDPHKLAYGYNIRRQTLDPIVRDLAVGTPGVDFFPATSARDLIREAKGRVNGVVADGKAGTREFRAPLVVAADGVGSGLAKLSGIKAHEDENERFTYFTYYRTLPLTTSANAQYWHLGRDFAFAAHNDDDTTLLGIMMPRSELKAFRADALGNFRRYWDRVPDHPRIGDALPICELRGISRIANQWRRASAPGIAFVGDAATVLDPIWGTGCAFAFLSADWLVEATLPAFAVEQGAPPAIDRGLRRYRRVHRSRLRAHYYHIASFSKVRPNNPVDRLHLSAATRDSELARRCLTYVGRTVGLGHLMVPSTLLRAVVVNVRHLLSGYTNLETPPSRLTRGEAHVSHKGP
jgi:flavin-dependent dehydrogenase